MAWITLTRKDDRQPVDAQTELVSHVEQSGTGSLLVMTNRAELRVLESLDDVRLLLGIRFAEPAAHPAEKREKK